MEEDGRGGRWTDGHIGGLKWVDVVRDIALARWLR